MQEPTANTSPVEIDQHFALPPEEPEVMAWEMVDTGRYMPRRTRGSCKGRALG